MNQRAVTGLVAVLALILGVWGAITIAPPSTGDSETEPDTQYFQHYPAPRNLSEFSLIRANGKSLTNDDLNDQWSLVFLGYTYCPDICPTTMAALNRIYPQLKALDSNFPVRVLFISVDPKRDTTERLNEYIGFFNSEFMAASGGHDQLFPLVRSLGMMYALSESTDNPNYLVDHSASVVLLNPQAQVIGRFKPDLTPGKLAVADAQQILADMPEIISTK